jgi:DNA-binding transcriptional LysR family regulator
MDRLTSLATFAQVVESGGFSAAARRLEMSTTMVSNHIQALENRLGVRLLNRTTRRVSLTEVGADYYRRCAHILADIEEADRSAVAQQLTPKGTLRLYTNTHILRFVGPIISEYLALYPDVTVDLVMGERMIDLVEERIDLAIRTTPPPDSSLIVRRLIHWRHILGASPQYLEKHGAPQTLAELSQRNCLRYALYPYGDEWRFEDAKGAQFSIHVSGNLITTSAEVLRIAALDGRGLVLGPDFYAFEDLAQQRLIPVLTQYRPVQFAINAIYPAKQNLSAKVRTFLDHISLRINDHWAIIGKTLGTTK